MQQKVIFRADGGQHVGLGHIMRSLSLARYLKEDFLCSFATTNSDEHIHQTIKQCCENIIQLPGNEEHFSFFLRQLNGDEIVVLDNYYYSTEYQKQIKKKGCVVVCIDDNQDRHFVADAVINHAEGVAKEKYSKEPYTKLLLGYKYALIRPEFINNSHFDANSEVHNVLVCIGGADPFNISEKIVCSLLSIEGKFQVNLVLGAAFQHQSSIDKLIISKQIKVFKNLSPDELANLMKKADFGVFPASTVAIEACAARLPFATGYFVDNQYPIYQGLINNGLAFKLGDLLNQTQEKLAPKLKSYLMDMEQVKVIRRKQRKMLDSRVSSRYLEAFKELALR